jgi:hypothetical protein
MNKICHNFCINTYIFRCSISIKMVAKPLNFIISKSEIKNKRNQFLFFITYTTNNIFTITNLQMNEYGKMCDMENIINIVVFIFARPHFPRLSLSSRFSTDPGLGGVRLGSFLLSTGITCTSSGLWIFTTEND